MKILVLGDFHGRFPNKLKKASKKVDLIISVGDFGGISEWYSYFRYVFRAQKKDLPIIPAKDFFGKEKYKSLRKKDEKSAKKVLSELNSLGKNVFFVFGNTDEEWYKYPFNGRNDFLSKSKINFLKNLKNLKNITYGKTKFQKINLVGFGGYVDIDSYIDEARIDEDFGLTLDILKRREKSKKKLFELLNLKGNKILILHYPPKGYFDIINSKGNVSNGNSAGVGFFREAIEKFKPSLVLFGHMHEYQGMKKLGNSVLINPGCAVKGKGSIIDFDENKGKVKRVKFI